MAKKQAIPERDFFIGRANYLSSQNEKRNEKYKRIDQMINEEWDLPDQLKSQDWIFKQVTTFFSQAITAAVRILADIKPKFNITPAGDLSQKTVDGWERAIRWILRAASKRRPNGVVPDVVESSVRYSEVCQQVIFNKVQFNSLKAAGGNSNRWKAIQRMGPVTVIGYHPKMVHARFSDVGPEEVALIAEMDPHDIVDLYGDQANDLKEWIQQQDGQEDLKVVLYDYVSYDWRYVGVYTGELMNNEIPEGADLFDIIPPSKWKWPLLPWVIRYRGSTMERDSDKQRRTLLDDAVNSNAYETMNRVKTLRFSEMLRYAGSSKRWFQSDDRETPTVGMAAGDLYTKINTEESVGDFNPPLPDPGLGQMDMELRMDAQRSTLSEILFGGDIPGGTAYSTINLVTHSALNVLKDARQLAQDAMSDLAELILLWAHYTQTDLTGYGMDRDDRGKEYLIMWKDIDPENLYIDCDLSADLPTDRQARIMGAMQAIQAGLLSRVSARDELGITDGKMEEKKIIKDQVFDVLLSSQLENLKLMNSQAFIQEIRQQVMNEIGAKMAAGGGGDGAEPPPNEAGGEIALGGPVPPGEGEGGVGPQNFGQGTPPTGLPSDIGGRTGVVPAELGGGRITREMQSGQTMGDEEIVEV